MLSAFTPRPIVELKPRDKSKIESILAFGNRLLVGLSTGSLRIYRVNEDNPELPQSEASKPSQPQPPFRVVELLREQEKFSARAVQQLAIIKEANILISLSDSVVSIHDLLEFNLQEQLTKTKGASTFAVTSDIIKDASTGIPSIVSRLAVAVKRRLLIWSWHDTELSSDITEITLATPAKSFIWASATKIICGMNTGYIVVDITTSEMTDIVGPGSIGGATGQETSRFGGVGAASMGYMGMSSWVPKPLATRLTDGELLLAKDINTLFVDSEGTPLEKRQIPWSTAPEAISFSYPYLLALHSSGKGTLEVRNPDTRSLLQSIPLPNATQLHVPPPNVSLAHAGKGFLAVSDRCIWRMEAEAYATQIDQLVEKGRYDEAISLLDMLEDALVNDKEGRMREVKIQKAQALFDARKYGDSLDLFADVSAPPERVIRLYPPVISGNLNPATRHAESDVKSPHEDSESAIPEGSKSPTRSKAKLERRTGSDSASITSSRKADRGDGSDAGSVGKPLEPEAGDKRLEGDDLQDAVSGLCGFLADTRRKLQRYLNPDGTLKPPRNGGDERPESNFETLLVAPTSSADEDRAQKLLETARLVDTTLFKAYMLARPTLAGSLFRIANYCDPDIVNEKLLEARRYAELVDFLHGKKLHRPALDLLKKYGQAEIEEAPPALRGSARTIAYLQSLPPSFIDLILDFAEWPIRQGSETGMEIFLADTENAETLPRERVLAFLEKLDDRLAVRYLEHVVHELNDLTPTFHQRLVNLYMERLTGNGSDKDAKTLESSDEDQRNELTQKLLEFLKSSNQYSTAKALNLIPRNDPDFYEARAIVLSKMGQHKQALEIYVFQLHSPEKAEEYCNHIHVTLETEDSPVSDPHHPSASTFDDSAPQSIYHTLLSLYLTPPPPHQPDWPPALDLLSKHGSRLPASSTLNIIPAALPIKELESYFRARVRAANSLVNQGRIEAGLRKTERIAAQATLMLGGDARTGGARSRRVVVGEDRVCGVCHRRLGGSAISVMPDNSVVHYGCANRGQQGGSSSMDALRKGSAK